LRAKSGAPRCLYVSNRISGAYLSRIARRNVKGAFIQIMPLTWDSLLLPVNGQAPLAHDLTGSTSGLRRGSLSNT
jgi:hypothetical protein